MADSAQTSYQPSYDPAEEVVDLCRDLIRIDPTNFGDDSGPGERKAAEHVAALLDEVCAIFRGRTRDEWLAFFQGHDVCLTPVNQPIDALRDPHVLARGVVKSVPGLRTILPPFTRDTPTLAPAPTLGQHTQQIVRELGS